MDERVERRHGVFEPASNCPWGPDYIGHDWCGGPAGKGFGVSFEEGKGVEVLVGGVTLFAVYDNIIFKEDTGPV